MEPTPPPTAAATYKLKLMCSYGGQIRPRPDSNALFYAGGDTRIIGIPTTTPLSLSSLTRHVSDTLHVTTPFILKYQLPNHTLDYLISVFSDEDIATMLDEHRIVSPAPSRIRLFLFLVKSPGSGSGPGSGKLAYPKRESWFVDALKSVKIGGDNGGGVDGGGSCGAESLVLETSSSFGSTSSSASLSNSGVRGGGCQVVEDHGIVSNLFDVKVKVSGNETLLSGNNAVAGTTPSSLVAANRDHPVGPIAIPENLVSSNLSDFQAQTLTPPTAGVEAHQATIGFPYTTSVPSHYYVPYNATGGAIPTSPYHGPVYVVPLEQPRNHQPLHQVAYKIAAPQVYAPTTIASHAVNVNVPHNEKSQQPAGFLRMNHHALPASVGVTPAETTHYENGLDDDPAHVQIYKSQPPPPGSQYQSMTKATPLFASRFAVPKHDQSHRSRALEGLDTTSCGHC